jgi:hypothetical protein
MKAVPKASSMDSRREVQGVFGVISTCPLSAWIGRHGTNGVGRFFLEHTLMVSDFMAALELDCRERTDVRLLHAHDLPKPKGRENSREPFRWTVDIPGKRRVGVVPDKVFALEVTHPDDRTECTHYFLEADQGTMPVKRRDMRQSCVLRKLEAYEATYMTQAYRRRFGEVRSRTLILTSKPDRSDSIHEALALLKNGRRHYLVMVAKTKNNGLDSQSLLATIRD